MNLQLITLLSSFSRSVVSNSLQLHGPPHTRLPLSFTMSPSLLKLMSIESVMPSNHLILSPPSGYPSNPFNYSSEIQSHILPLLFTLKTSLSSESSYQVNLLPLSPAVQHFKSHPIYDCETLLVECSGKEAAGFL